MIDIGMNVGIASLFFSLKDSVETIIGFEPVPETYEQGKYNFSLNDNYSRKITAYNYGLGDKKRLTDVAYDPGNKGKASIYGNHPGLKNREVTGELKTTRVSIEDCAILSDFIHRYENLNKIVKIDCEGAEYEIIERMNEIQILQNINTLMIEWHFKDPGILEKRLRMNGFTIYSFHNPDRITGMIFAVNNVDFK